MSIPGLHRVEPNLPPSLPSLAVKVTGRNFAGLSYLVSLQSERHGIVSEISAKFADTGDLIHVVIDGVVLEPGSVVYLHPGAQLSWSSEAFYNELYRPVA